MSSASGKTTSGFLQAHLQGIPGAIWALFLVFTVLWLVIASFSIGEENVRIWMRGWRGEAIDSLQTLDLSQKSGAASHHAMEEAAIYFLSAIDAIWLLLAATSLYFWLIRAEGLSTGRRWGMLILVSTAVLGWVGATTGFPFGPLIFTNRMGLKPGGVLPFTYPLLWFVIVVTARYTTLKLLPKANHLATAAGTAILACATDVNLEFIAWKVRAYWIWHPANIQPPAWPPVQNFIAWLVIAGVLAFLMREQRLASPRRAEWRPVILFSILNGAFATVHAARWIGS